MKRLDQDELLAQLESFEAIYFEACKIAKTNKILIPYAEQACKQIKEMIQKPGVTEEWIEEKVKKLITMVANLYPCEGSPCVVPKSKAKDFIHKFIEEIHGRKMERVAEDWIQGEPYE